MNKRSYQRTAAAALAVVMAGSLLAACGQEPQQTLINPVATTTAPTTAPTTEPLGMETFPMETELLVDAPAPGSISYEAYLELEEAVQEAYYGGFENADAFFAWLDEAQAAYEVTQPTSSSDFEEGVEDWE